MNDERFSKEQSEALMKALNDAIQEGPWDKSNFLRMIGKSLIEIRENLSQHLNPTNSSMTESHVANRVALRTGQQEIYISLYSTNGTNLQSWERIIANLPRQMISRPIYADEADIKEALKIKENKQNEAYVAIYINQTDILPLNAEKLAVDKLGKKLLSLKDKVLNLDNISRFVHISGVYRYNRGRLVKF